MKLTMATSWENRLLQTLSEQDVKVYEIYGSLPTTVLGSARESEALPKVEFSQAREHIDLAHSLGIKFLYAFNSSCFGNLEQTVQGRIKILEHLEFVINKLGVDSVVVTLPFLIELMKKEFPKVEVVVSTVNHIKSVQEAKFYENLGADRLTVSYMINRNFELLQNIIKATTCTVELLANESCMFHCPYRSYHYNLVCHASQKDTKIVQYPFMKCTIDKLRNPAEFIKARWIRPEDVDEYENLGITFLKLAGREKSTDWLIRCVLAFSEKRYLGNLLDILAIPRLSTDTFGIPTSNMIPFPPMYINNQALGDFLSYFRTHGSQCDWACHKCNYCGNVAENVMAYDASEINNYLDEVESLRSCFTESFVTV